MPGLPKWREFHPDCPYYQGKTPGGGHPPICRLREKFKDGRVFVRDSFGDNVWIDVTDFRGCPLTCLCHSLDGATEEDNFAFTVIKSPTSLQVRFHSDALRRQVLVTVRPFMEYMTVSLVDDEGLFNGLALLKCLPVLLYESYKLGGELYLFVSGILSEPDTFRSLGLDDLCRQGWLHTRDLQSFRCTLAIRMIEKMKKAFTNSFNPGLGELRKELDENFHLISWLSKVPDPIETKDPRVEGVHAKIRKARLKTKRLDLVLRYGTPEAFLLQASRDGDVLSARTLLQSARDEAQDSLSIPEEVLNLDAVLGGTTALIEAVRGGYVRIARTLIQYGADVNAGTPSETALAVAAKCGSEAMLRLLLGHGADVHIAVLTLRADGPAGPVSSAINRLDKSAALYRTSMFLDASRVRKEVALLRHVFLEEHQRMVELALQPGSWDDIGIIWTSVLEREPQQAWNLALRTIRHLCGGILPRNLNETLLLITMSKAISSVVHGSDDGESWEEFRQDLGRWQLLFQDDLSRGLTEFRGAVRTIWGVDVCTLDPTPHAGENVLAAFQDMVLRCFFRANELFETEAMDDLGLTSTQNRWRERQQEASTLEAPGPSGSSLAGTESDGPCVQETAAERLVFDILLDPPKPPPPLSQEPTPYQRLFVILIAGAIFAAIIAFLLLIREGPIPYAAFGTGSAMSAVAEGSMPSDSPFAQNSPYDGLSADGRQPPGFSVDDSVKDLFRPRLTGSTGQRARGTLRDLLAARCGDGERLERTERTYYLLAAYLGLPPCQSVPAAARTRQRPPVNPALSPPRPTAKGERREKKRKVTFCEECQREFHTTPNYGRHRAGPDHKNVRHTCSFSGCGKSYSRRYVRDEHERAKHGRWRA